MQRFVAGSVQMTAGLDKGANLATAIALVEEAAARGAQLVALPELWNCLGPLPDVVAQAEPIPGPTTEALAALARRLNITLIAGSIAERSPQPGKAWNTAIVLGPDGSLLARYRKIHLFDVHIPDRVSYTESKCFLPGEDVVRFDTPLARIGLGICYDLRFPELFRALSSQGIDVLALVSAFSSVTGPDHFEPLLRARAIENQCFVLAPNQVGRHSPDFATHGHSMILDPWGRVLASMTDDQGVITAELDPAMLTDFRTRLPALAHRRLR